MTTTGATLWYLKKQHCYSMYYYITWRIIWIVILNILCKLKGFVECNWTNSKSHFIRRRLWIKMFSAWLDSSLHAAAEFQSDLNFLIQILSFFITHFIPRRLLFYFIFFQRRLTFTVSSHVYSMCSILWYTNWLSFFFNGDVCDLFYLLWFLKRTRIRREEGWILSSKRVFEWPATCCLNGDIFKVCRHCISYSAFESPNPSFIFLKIIQQLLFLLCLSLHFRSSMSGIRGGLRGYRRKKELKFFFLVRTSYRFRGP